jgi:hypothetical protein
MRKWSGLEAHSNSNAYCNRRLSVSHPTSPRLHLGSPTQILCLCHRI